MSDDIKINNQNIIIPFQQDGTDCLAYIPQPTMAEFDKIARPLGFIFTKFKQKEFDELVIAKDWEFIIEDYLSDKKGGEEAFNDLLAFLDRKLIVENFFYKDTGETLKRVDDSVLQMIKGTLLFFSSLLRYAPQIAKTSYTKDYITSLSVMDFQSSLKRRHEGQEASAELKQ